MKIKKKIMFAFVAMLVVLSISWAHLTREIEISGDRLKSLVVESYSYMYSSWCLYFEDQHRYCLRYSRPVVPIRYCVSKRDLEIRNSKDSKTSEIGFIGINEFVLKANRQPGLAEEVF